MTMHRPIAAKDQRGIGLVGGIEFIPGEDADARNLEGADFPLVDERSEDGNGAHALASHTGAKK